MLPVTVGFVLALSAVVVRLLRPFLLLQLLLPAVVVAVFPFVLLAGHFELLTDLLSPYWMLCNLCLSHYCGGLVSTTLGHLASICCRWRASRTDLAQAVFVAVWRLVVSAAAAAALLLL